MESEEVRCLLEGSGLTPLILNPHLPTLNPLYGPVIGGVRVVVPEDQAERALDVLREAGRLSGPGPAAGKSFHPAMDISGGNRYFALALLAITFISLATVAASLAIQFLKR